MAPATQGQRQWDPQTAFSQSRKERACILMAALGAACQPNQAELRGSKR
jgi:hypothetical protein